MSVRVKIEDHPSGKGVLLMMQGHDGGPVGDDQPWASHEYPSMESLANAVSGRLSNIDSEVLIWIAADKALAEADRDPAKVEKARAHEVSFASGKADYGVVVASTEASAKP